jgi:hypothetical protein
MRIRFADGTDGDQVTDVRLVPSSHLRGQLTELVVDGLVVGKNRPGTLFGYDRHPKQGPWVIRAVVRALHRHTGYLTWDDVDRVDWDERVVLLRTNELRELAPSGP